MTMESKTENKSADQKEDTANPGVILDAKIINAALITRENSPNVSILIGKVRRKTNGFINIFIRPRTIARIKDPASVTSTPGRR